MLGVICRDPAMAMPVRCVRPATSAAEVWAWVTFTGSTRARSLMDWVTALSEVALNPTTRRRA